MNAELAVRITDFVKNHSACQFSIVEKEFGADPKFHDTWWEMLENVGGQSQGFFVRMDANDRCYPGPKSDLAKLPTGA